jgi:LmbE family N-acetylglucosaminyl deacetylase
MHGTHADKNKNQLEEKPSRRTIDAVYARLTAPPSQWHQDMRNLYEATVAAVSLEHQAKWKKISKDSQRASSMAIEVARSIIDKLEQRLSVFERHKESLMNGRALNGNWEEHESEGRRIRKNFASVMLRCSFVVSSIC